MTREELLTVAANQAQAWRKHTGDSLGNDWPWHSEDALANEYGLPEPDAVFMSLASPDAVLELLREIDDLRMELAGEDA